MSFARQLLLVTSLISIASAASAQLKPVPAAVSNNAVTRGELPALVQDILKTNPDIVKDVIMSNPDMIMDALEKLRVKKEATAKQEAAAALEKNKAEIFSTDAPYIGAPNADITVVEFFDYHCGYCKHFLPELSKVLAEDKKLRVIFKDLPILSEDSVTAARASLAVNRIDRNKYFEYHQMLMNTSGKFDEKALLEAGKKVGIKPETLKAEMAKPEITAILDRNRKLAESLGINGTPGLVIGNEVIPGAISAEELKRYISEQRNPKPAAPATATPTKTP